LAVFFQERKGLPAVEKMTRRLDDEDLEDFVDSIDDIGQAAFSLISLIVAPPARKIQRVEDTDH
jgi:hypothetical protein